MAIEIEIGSELERKGVRWKALGRRGGKRAERLVKEPNSATTNSATTRQCNYMYTTGTVQLPCTLLETQHVLGQSIYINKKGDGKQVKS